MPLLQQKVDRVLILHTGPRGPRGANWRGAWNSDDTYQEGDIARLDPEGNLWYALRENTGAQPDLNPSDWDFWLPNTGIGTLPVGTMQYQAAWSALTTYQPGAVVLHNGQLYLCTTANLNQVPPDAAYWRPFQTSGSSGAVVYRGDWVDDVTYYFNEWVRYANALYRCIVTESLNNLPTDSTVWALVITENFSGQSSGFQWKGEVPTLADLPNVDNAIGDKWFVVSEDKLYRWDGSAWASWSQT